MEIMLESDIPSYAGGLGVLAGDVLRSCADLQIPSVAVSLVYSGYTFSQHIDPDGNQKFFENDWQRMDQLTKLPQRITLNICDTKAIVSCWRYDIVGLNGFNVPVYLLDTNLPENPQWIRNITKNLYASTPDVRICQEIILGIGGVKMLDELGYKNIPTYHLNEGHCSFVPLGLMHEYNFTASQAKQKCVFITHTPVAEGHDVFTYELAQKYLSAYLPPDIKKLSTPNKLHMTILGLNLSRLNLAVSQKHRQVCQSLFPDHNFISITNGVHHRSWTWHVFQDLYDKYLPGWLDNPELLSTVPEKIPDDAVWAAHLESKRELVTYVNHHLAQDALSHGHEASPDDLFETDTLLISLARRPVAYKRPLLLYSDLEHLVKIATGKIQIIQCGKASPTDTQSQEFVKQIIKISQSLKKIIRIVYLENYSPKIARLLVAGSDIWLNTPRRPMEACGTSGMKASLNGVLNFSVLDGWWLEGYDLAPKSGFSIGPKVESFNNLDGQIVSESDKIDAQDLYFKLENEIIPTYYNHRSEWISHMKQSITQGAHFNSHRLVKEYDAVAWTYAK